MAADPQGVEVSDNLRAAINAAGPRVPTILAVICDYERCGDRTPGNWLRAIVRIEAALKAGR